MTQADKHLQEVRELARQQLEEALAEVEPQLLILLEQFKPQALEVAVILEIAPKHLLLQPQISQRTQ